ncbi:HAD family hydrolase [Oceanicola sp. 22II-s10i]|uniref:HAD-IA family hydrolase n=1 Tax=Oceanicola sp. 22II-s10i TaxID=1317116 RepID=UPI000B526897|nr:HAD-IA family hydrolase [Oceanicola sp. 22II-s10i]OWU84010.1 HAD family hydrolase [Oceanicola sp. 22II-s10i]
MTGARLVIFDVDGTLSDSQGHILASMRDAFDAVGAPLPPREVVLSIVGLSLEVAIPRLAPQLDAAAHQAMVDGYRAGFRRRREAGGVSATPLYDGMAQLVTELAAEPETLLAVATGKSMRGLRALLEGNGLEKHFVSLQTADNHPSKPHPAMLLSAMADAGVGPERSVMIGDTSFDMDMARAAGMRGIAVGWGYHPETELASATTLARSAAELRNAIDTLLPRAEATA